MKRIFVFILFPTFLYSQIWIDKMQDPKNNFYDTQKEFENYWEDRTIEKGKGWKQFKRWENFIAPRVYPDGVQHPDILFQEYNKIKQRSNPQYLVSPTSNWEQVGPNNVPLTSSGTKRGIGRVNTIAFHPTNPDIIYVGAPAGGFWKSIDHGQNWSTTTDFLTNLGVSDIAIDPTNPDIIYIATGDRDAGDTYSYGLMKSIDGGNTFNTTGLSFNITNYYRGNRVLIDPTNTSIIIVATNGGIYRSIDAGVSFTNTYSGINMTDIEFHVTNSDIIYGASKGNTSIYKSTDNGITWSQSGSGLPSTSDVVRSCVAVTPDNPQVVYALFGDNNNGFYAVYKSIDEGLNWSQQANSPNLLGWSVNGTDNDGQAWYDLALTVSPTDENTLFVGGVNCWKSSDGGVSWTINTHWYGASGTTYMHADEHMLKYNLLNNRVYSGNDGGLYYSDDDGDDWTDISDGLQITQFYSLGVAQTVQDMVITGSQDNGTFLNTNLNWDAVIGGDGMECIIDYTNSNIMYGALYYGDVRKSTNGGNSFSSIGPSNDGAWETPYVLDKNDPEIIYIGYEEIQKSIDGGSTWSQITNGETNGGKIDEIDISKSNPDVIFFSDGSDIFKTINGGLNWQQVNNNLPNKKITYIIIHPANENIIWVTFSGYTAGEKVYKSIDGGNNWTNISGTLPNMPVNCIELDKNNTNETVYIGTDLGVYTTDSTLTDWILFNTALPHVIVNELEIQYQSNKLFAATYGRGLWSIDLPITSPPIANFSYNDSIFCGVPADVSFINNSYYSDSYYWDFGDGNTSTSANPTHTYTSFGTFSVQLIASGPLGVDTILQQQIINIDQNNICITTLPTSGSGSIQTLCNGILYDVGGPNGNYYDGQDSWITISPPGSNQITLTFTEFDVEAPSSSSICNWDYLEIFDGDNLSAPSLGQFCNTLTGSPGVISSTGGSITVFLHSDGNVNGTGFEADWTCIFPSAPPVSIFSLSDSISCSPTISFYDLSTNGPTSWLWDFGDGNTSTNQNPIHTYLNNGTYTVKLITTNNFGTDSIIINNAITIIDVDLQINNGITCVGDSLTLIANSPSGVINWYDDASLQNLVSVGNNFTTPILNTTTTYYAQSAYEFNNIYGGAVDTSIGSGSYFTGNQHLIFDAYVASKIVSVMVYAQNSNTITFELRDNTSTIIEDTTITVSAGAQRIYFDFDVPVGNNYELGVSSSNSGLFRNDVGVNYPYDIGGLISITGSSGGGNYYYFYYDIEVTKQPCLSNPEQVLAIVNNNTSSISNLSTCDSLEWNGNIYTQSGNYNYVTTNSLGCDSIAALILTVDTATFSTDFQLSCDTFIWVNGNIYTTNNNTDTFVMVNTNGCDSIITLDLTFVENPEVNIVQIIDNLQANTLFGTSPYTYEWNTGEITSVITPASSGTYWCLVTDINGCISDTAIYNVNINSFIDIIENTFNIYPNPTTGLLNITFYNNVTSEIQIKNVLGEIIFHTMIFEKGKINKQIDLSDFANGIYILEFNTIYGVINKKIVLE